MILYHLDRNASLHEGQILTLQSLNSCNLANSEIARNLFPDGLSSHGIQYLQKAENRFDYGFVQPSGSYFAWLESLKSATDSLGGPFSEIYCELIRRIFFPSFPSRLQCLFAVSSMEELLQWNDCSGFSAEKPVFEVYVSDDFPCFDSRLLKGGFCLWVNETERQGHFDFEPLENLQFAFDYWNGKRDSNPRLEYLIPLPVTVGRQVR